MKRQNKENQIAVKELGGTPNNTHEFFSGLLGNGGINAGAKTLFLFDNDKAGRSSHKTLCKSQPEITPTNITSDAFAWALPFTDEFKGFTKKYRIKDNQAFFTAEFLYPASAASALCAELLLDNETGDILNWKKCIHGDYNNSLSQAMSVDMRNTEEETGDWLFARGVPNDYKERFSNEALNRDFDTTNIDAVVAIVIETLGVKLDSDH